MIRSDEKSILYIEPKLPATAKPVIDEVTRKMTGAYQRSVRGPAWRGFHTCSCGAKSDNCEHILEGGVETNSLCIHYLAYHRAEVPEAELEKVRNLAAEFTEPMQFQLAPPPVSTAQPVAERMVAHSQR